MNIQATTASASSSLKSTAASAAQEATETAAVTKAEAAKGDQQAIRKLAAQQQAAPQPSVSPEGVGKSLDLTA